MRPRLALIVLLVALPAGAQSPSHTAVSGGQGDPRADHQIEEAQKDLDRGDISLAVEKLDSLLAAQSDNVRALLLYAEAARRCNQMDVAIDTLHHATRLDPRNPDAWSRLGDMLLTDRPKEAVQPFATAVRLAPGNVLALAGLATANAQTGKTALAQEEYARAMALNAAAPHPSAMVEFLFARFLADGHQYRSAVFHFDRALSLDPDLEDARFERAETLLPLHRYGEALNDLNRIPAGSRHELATLYLLVRVYRETGNPSKAAETANRVEELSAQRDRERVNGHNIAWRLESASQLMARQSCPEAAAAYEAILRDHPEVTAALVPLGECYLRMGHVADTAAVIRRAIEREPQSAEAHYVLGRVLLIEHQPGPARSEFERSMSLDPFGADARVGLAAVEMTEEHDAAAVQILSRVQSIAPRRLDARLMLSEALARNGEPEKAMAEVKSVLKLDPSNEAAKQMLKALQSGTPQPEATGTK